MDQSVQALYRAALFEEMNSPDPLVRGLACQVAGGIPDPRAIAQLGALIDDGSPSVAALLCDMTQFGPVRRSWTRPTMGQIARTSLYSLTGMLFATAGDFAAWWTASADCDKQVWYWCAKWARECEPKWQVTEHEVRPVRRPNSDATGADVEADITALARLPGDTGLKILLLRNNPRARQAEAALAIGGDAHDYARRMYVDAGRGAESGPDTAATAAYVERNNLQPRLIELLFRTNVWREIESGGYADLVREIVRVGERVFGTGDEPAIAEAARLEAGNPVVAERLALLRSRIAPDQALVILTTALRDHPGMTELARELVTSFGITDQGVVEAAFAAASDDGRTMLASAVKSAAQAQQPVSAEFLSAAADMLAEPAAPGYASARALAYLAAAANLVSQAEIIAADDIEALSPRTTKGPLTPEMERHNSRIADVFRRVKGDLIAGLRR
ncbi:MAG: hypothetical protein JSV65_14680 [Armatimonadota bacterium]|nr:MAG: hypothetical protein JSV65_14680 [Armatimonadota bacterium]